MRYLFSRKFLLTLSALAVLTVSAIACGTDALQTPGPGTPSGNDGVGSQPTQEPSNSDNQVPPGSIISGLDSLILSLEAQEIGRAHV